MDSLKDLRKIDPKTVKSIKIHYPNLGPGNRHPFDLKPSAALKRGLSLNPLSLRVRAMKLAGLSGVSGLVRLPQPQGVRPVVTS